MTHVDYGLTQIMGQWMTVPVATYSFPKIDNFWGKLDMHA